MCPSVAGNIGKLLNCSILADIGRWFPTHGLHDVTFPQTCAIVNFNATLPFLSQKFIWWDILISAATSSNVYPFISLDVLHPMFPFTARFVWWRLWRGCVTAAALSATACWRSTKTILRLGGSRGGCVLMQILWTYNAGIVSPSGKFSWIQTVKGRQIDAKPAWLGTLMEVLPAELFVCFTL